MMQIRLLTNGYKNNEQFYRDFIDGTLEEKEEYFTDKIIELEHAGDFPIYMGSGTNEFRREQFMKAFEVIARDYLNTIREIHLDELFWHSLFCTVKREYLLEQYPSVKNSIKEFNNIVLKKFDWENYVYKCVLGAQYVTDRFEDEKDIIYHYNLTFDNLDIYNYILKYTIFRNDQFVINILEILGEDKRLSEISKSKILDRPDLGKDERYGRRVIYEFNKSYPIVMAPMMEKDELREYFYEYLALYYQRE